MLLHHILQLKESEEIFLAEESLNDLVTLLSPRWMRVVGDFSVRGNIKTIVFAEHAQPGYTGPRPEFHRYMSAE